MKDKSLLLVVLVIISIASGYYIFVINGKNNKEKIKEVIEPSTVDEIEESTQDKDLIESTTEQSLDNSKETKMSLRDKLNTPKPEMVIDKSKDYIVTLKTNMGDIVIKMYTKDKPITVNSFIYLAKLGYYNDVKFHRVIEGFMIQGGDPKGDGTGGPAYEFEDELNSPNKNNIGTIAMANPGMPNSNGSQFFINVEDNNYLDTKHTVFGEVIEGMDVVTKIEKTEKAFDPNARVFSIPKVDIVINNVIVEEK